MALNADFSVRVVIDTRDAKDATLPVTAACSARSAWEKLIGAGALRMLRLTGPICAAAILLLASGCTWQQAAYNVGQAWQRGSCTKLPEQAERDRCLSSTNVSYEEYRRKTEGTTREQNVRAGDATTSASRPPLPTPQTDGLESSRAQ